MICQTYITNDIVTIDIVKLKLGLPYNISPVDDELLLKYKIYKNDDTRRKNGTFLQLIITEGKKGFRLTGSLRKWWFGRDNYKDDFDLKTFLRCVRLLAKCLGITEACFWMSSFTYLEFGANTVFESKDRVILDCIVGFPRRKYHIHQDETIGFKLAKRDTHTLYDKVAEVRRGGGMPASEKKKLDEKIFVLRYELKLNPKDFKKITNNQDCTLNEIRKHWKSLTAQWIYDFREIELVNRLPTINKPDLTTVTAIREYMETLGVESYGGMRQVWTLIYGNKKIRKKKEIYTAIANSYPPNREPVFQDFKDYLYDKIFETAEKCL